MTFFDKPRANAGIARVLCRLVATAPEPPDREWALHAIAPEGAGDYTGRKDDAVVETLDAMVDLKLLATDNGRLAPGPEWEPGSDTASDVHSFRALIRKRLFAVKPGQLLAKGTRGAWGASGGRDLLRALGWLASQDPLRPFLGWGVAPGNRAALDPEQTHDNQLGFEDRFVRNEAQWRAFHRWATFLGFATQAAVTSVPRGTPLLIADPTTAVADIIDGLTDEVSADAFLRFLGKELPVLDTGWVRLQTDGCRRDDAPEPVSPALSGALLRLSDAGRLTFRNPADSPPAQRIVLRLGTRAETIATVKVNHG